ncbi:efflux RND transporter periplasmic adaptor subunit [Candidatus Methylospira mobilis]|uniref:Efflux RND transporter periplasmic adaptor subunit n=1 Tax=Candidatus Methylospira mobilis TaxID=1808979 RepID=A0A5Q0BRB1_9GAMM|nr:efflux RND transporter periplasmic adaptor subunit [Candidatus Methylospira mobilis]QFY44734.1 efflux RND transporter periplasmic adaptor subunit [Candidatus Methylospira mobilis]WNV05730.1 efflux RND transporter periplasmic adaptor subunit [Candidatus Methylospira mobilis]
MRDIPYTLKLCASVVLVFLLSACSRGTGNANTAAPSMPPSPVKTALPVVRTLVDWDEYSGRLESVGSVEIRARVNGYLEKVCFKAGDKVRKGDLLFVIDQRPYRIEFQHAQAEVERTRARLDLAQNDYERAERLFRAKAISAEEQDARSKGLREATATMNSAVATMEAARLNLTFTEVRAPISGRIGRELITTGNLVNGNGGGASLLAEIVSIDPIYLYIDADELSILKYRRLTREGKRVNDRDTELPAEMQLMNEADFPHQGVIDYVDPRMNADTGTLRIRAVFSNGDDQLSPGFFARLRIPGSEPHDAILIPDRALGTDQGQKFIWVVAADNTVEYRKVKTGALSQGLRVISEGLAPQERVVIEGVQRLKSGAKVQPEAQ